MDTKDNTDARGYIYKTSWKGSVLGLSRIEKLLSLTGNPQKKLKFVHVAGTNGKGSTSAFIANILMAAGLNTGLYTSPYITRLNETIAVNGETISDGELDALVAEMRTASLTGDDEPTEYEKITALALLHFVKKKCDIVVLEVGLGGRLDSTNVIDAPDCAVITNIGLDHMAFLGDTVSLIAAEKAGIIKKDCDVVLYPQTDEVRGVIRNAASCVNARITDVNPGLLKLLESGLTGQTFDYKGYKSLFISLLGEHQLLNAATAIEAVSILNKKGFSVTDKAIYEGLKKTLWPGRFEILLPSPVFVLDGSHNAQGAISLKDALNHYFPNRKITFIMGVLRDKELTEILAEINPLAKRYITVTPPNERALTASELAEVLRNYNSDVVVGGSVGDGVAIALDNCGKDDIICAFGSLYMQGEIRTKLNNLNGGKNNAEL